MCFRAKLNRVIWTLNISIVGFFSLYSEVIAQLKASNGQPIVILGDQVPFEVWPGVRLWGDDAAPSMGVPHMMSSFDRDECASRCASQGFFCKAFTWSKTQGGCRFFKSIDRGLRTKGYDAWIRTDNSLIPGREIFEEDRLSDIERDTIHSMLSEDYGGAEMSPGFGPHTRPLIERFQSDLGAEHVTGFLSRAQIGHLVWSDRRREDFERHRSALVAAPENPFLAATGCNSVSDEISRLSSEYASSLWPKTTSAQKSFNVDLSIPTVPDRFPAFLILAFSEPVRIAGDFGYVLQPGARFAFDLPVAPHRTRLVVPLFTAHTPKSLEVKITPILARSIEVETLIAAPSACGAKFHSMSSTSFETEVGAPRLVVHEQLTSREPLRVLRTPDQSRYIEIHDGSFILRTAEGIVLLDTQGTDVALSETGRFLTSYLNRDVSIWDTLDGEYIGGGFSWYVGWHNSDSFAHSLSGDWGMAKIYSTGYPSNPIPFEIFTCRTCSALPQLIHFSMEDDLVWAEVGMGTITSLSSKEYLDDHEGIDHAFRSYSDIQPVEKTIGYKYQDFLSFVVDDDTIEDTKDVIGISEWRMRFGGVESCIGNSHKLCSDVRDGFSADGLRILRRLSDTFGLSYQSIVQFQEQEQGNKYTYEERKAGITSDVRAVDPKLLALEIADCDPELNTQIELPTQGLTETVCADWLDKWRLDHEGIRYTLISGGTIFGNAGAQFFTTALHRSDVPGKIALHAGAAVYDATEPWPCVGGCGFEAHLLGRRYIVSFSRESTEIDVFDLETNQIQHVSAHRGNLTSMVRLTADERHLLQINRDGSFALHRLAESGSTKPKLVLQGTFRDDEVLAWNEGFEFESSFEGAHLMHLRFEGAEHVLPFESFSSRLETKGLVSQTLLGQAATTKKEISLPPILSTKLVSEDETSVEVSVYQTAGNRADQIVVYQDGQFDRAFEDIQLPVQLKIEKRAGSRTLSVLGLDTDGQTGIAKQIEIFPRQAPKSIYLLSLGVADFEDQALSQLGYTLTDVFEFSSTLSDYTRTDPTLELASMEEFGRSATPERFLKALQNTIAQASQDDVVALHLATHGLTAKDGELFVALRGTDSEQLLGTAIAWADLEGLLEGASAKVLLFLDLCHGGLAGTDLFTPAENFVSKLVEGRTTTVLALAASKGRERANEAEGGVAAGNFTASVIDVLFDKAKKYDTNKSGRIEVSELYENVKRKVTQATGGAQTPWLTRNRLIGDFPVW